MKITITATRPDGVSLLWSDQGWTPNQDDASRYQCVESAQQDIRTRQPFVGLVRLGWLVAPTIT